MNKAVNETTPVEYSAAAVKTLHFRRNARSVCFNLHWHDRIEIIRVKEGTLWVECYKNTICLQAGEMIFFTPRTAHKGFTRDTAVDYDVLMFDIRNFYNKTTVCNQYLPLLYNGDAKFEHRISDAQTIGCVDAICNSENTDSLEIIFLIYKLIHSMFEKHLCSLSPEPNNKIKSIVDYIDENYMLDVNTAGLSRMFNYSAEHLCRKFKDAIGITPMTYLKICRLQQAQKLLRESECSVGEIATRCGFSDANYFTRCFKAHYGITPKKYIHCE